jgi:NifB/MoaA-like Fe-S oxidoreductase
MRYKENYDIVKTLMELSQKGIEFHLQIVAVPGYNCGEELEKTLDTLLNESIAALSIGIVPVGLTGFREHLTPLSPFNSDLALETLKIIDRYREKSPIIYGADELFLLTETPIPEADYYGDFPQLENGIGMLRLTLMNYEKKRKSFIKELDKSGGNFLILTSTLANTVLQEIADDLNNHLKQAKVKVQPIRNNFFGGYVGVSGLLTASDILSQVQPLTQENIIIPENLFNTDGLTLDDVSQLELHDKLQVPILIVDPYFEDWEWI